MSEASTEKNRSAAREIVTFSVCEQRFCMEIEHVLEIRGWTKATILPHAPEYVTGMMNLRGTVLPVVDLSLRLGLGPTDPSPRHVIIIARIQEQTVGFLVENVSDIATVNESDMQPTPDVSSSLTQAFIKGVYTNEGELIRAIDVYQILPRESVAAA